MGGGPRRDALRAPVLILVDTSAWIEYLRNTRSRTCILVDEVLAQEIAICDAVRMEVLAGARDEAHLRSLQRLLARAVTVPTRATDFDDAAALYRRCRREGETVRKLIDCLIASVAIRAGIPVLHSDGDFDVLARHTEMRVYE